MVEADQRRQIYTQNSAATGENMNNQMTPTVELESPLIKIGEKNAQA